MSDKIPEEIKKHRHPGYPIHPLLLSRWSPRAMSGEPMTDAELFPLFEAARWAPSSYNNQPWRFLYARRDTAHWDKFLDLMVPFNQQWAKNGSCLVVVVSKKTFDHNGKSAHTHSYDTGAAWMGLALEGAARHCVVHGAEGFDYGKAKQVLNVSDDHQVEAMIVIGKPAPKESLPQDLQQKEFPRDRRPLAEIMLEGGFS